MKAYLSVTARRYAFCVYPVTLANDGNLMKQHLLLLILVGLVSSKLWAFNGALKSSISLNFYSEQVSIDFSTDMLQARCSKVEDQMLLDYYRQLEKTDYRTLLNNLQQQQKQFNLNDWLFFQLMRNSVQEIFRQKSGLEQELACWFLLSQAGFDTRLTYLDQRVFVYVYSKDEVFEVPMIEEKGRTYVNLTSMQIGKKPATLYMLEFSPRPSGKAFSFSLQKFPKFQSQAAVRPLSFVYKGAVKRIDVTYDQTLVHLMRQYPLIAENEYLKFPMSPLLQASLVPAFQKLLSDKTPAQALELLLGFTRSSFAYKEDRESFGRSKPMIPDELFAYDFSDCEDRSALFYAMVKELLDLPMIIMAYPNHVTVAVALEDAINGKFVEASGRRYYICDPTGPVNSTAIGIFPNTYETMTFDIILKHK